jgi:putative transcriptional regulator
LTILLVNDKLVTSKIVKNQNKLVIIINMNMNMNMKRRMINVPLINTLKVQRAKLGINQEKLGELAGVSRQTISSIERGEYNPSVTLALKLAQILNVSVEDIFIYEEGVEDE